MINDSNKLVITAIIGVLIGLVLGRLLWYTANPMIDGQEAQDEQAMDDDKDSAIIDSQVNEMPVSSDVSVSVSAQTAGNSVQASITTDQSVWVVVRDNNDGAMGNILGARHAEPGDTKVSIALLRATETGRGYFVAIQPYDNGNLNYSVGAVMRNASGAPISASFTAL